MTQSSPARFTQGSIDVHVRHLAGFMVLGFLAMTIAQLIEAVYLGWLGTPELAAVAFTFPVVMGLSAATRGIGIGTGAVLARAMGGGDRAAARRFASHGLLLVLGFTLVCAAALRYYALPLFALLGAQGDILRLAVAYTDVWALGFPGFGLAMVASGLMRSFGDASFPGLVMTAGSVLQVVLGPALIFGVADLPGLGIEGAAWAFVLARTGTLLLCLYWFVVRERMLTGSFVEFGPNAATILHVGGPAMATNLIAPVTAGITTWILADYGAEIVAGFGVAARVEAVIQMVVVGISASAAPLVGQNWGAGLYTRVHATLALVYRYCLLWGGCAALLMWVGAATFVGWITADPAVRTTAVTYLYVVPVTLGFVGMLNAASGSFNALSKPAPPLVLALIRLFVVYTPCAILAGRHWGPLGVFVVTAIANLVMGLWAQRWNHSTVRRLQHQAEHGGATT